MPIQGAPEATLAVGGAVSNGPPKGVYRVKVNDSVLGKPSGKTGRIPLSLDLFVTGDNAHPEKEGKRLLKHRHWLPMASDDKEKQDLMNGMLQRQIYIPFGIDWRKERGASFDPRIFAGKITNVLIGDVKNEDGTFSNGVVAMAADAAKLPQPKTTENGVEGEKKTRTRR